MRRGDQSAYGKNWKKNVHQKEKVGIRGRQSGKSKGLRPTAWDKLCAKYPKKAMKLDFNGYIYWVQIHDGRKIRKGSK